MRVCTFRLLAIACLATSCGGGSGTPRDVGPTDAAEDRGLSDAPPSGDAIRSDVPAADSPDVSGDSSAADAADLLPPGDGGVTADGFLTVDLQADALGDLPNTVGDALADTSAPTDGEAVVPPVPLEVGDTWPGGTVVKTCGAGFLSTLPSPSGDIGILVLRGPHKEMGKQAGCLVGLQTGQFFGNLMGYFLDAVLEEAADLGLDPAQTTTLLVSMLNNLWLKMEPFVPEAYLEELAGFEEAILDDPALIEAWGQTQPLWGLHALVLLANISDLNWSGSLEEVLEKITEGASDPLQEYYAGLLADRLRRRGRLASRPSPLPLKTSCSFFAAWGERTLDGHLLGSRNLDWSTDTGIAVLKGITIYVPDEGHAHASIGYLGFPGALAGMGEQGLVVSEVGAESVMERLVGQPWTLKFREILQFSDDLDDAVQIAAGTGKDGKLRPPTIGYNWMVAFGDPPTGKASAAATVESNGLRTGFLKAGPDCKQEGLLVEYDEAGAAAAIVTHEDDPSLVNLEAGAVEIDGQGIPRLFASDGQGNVLLDAAGCPSLPDPQGVVFVTGRPLSCAMFRGDEAMMHGLRMWQLASNGPQGGQSLLCTSGSYRHRYLVMHDMLDAFAQGQAYTKDGVVLIGPSGQPMPVGLQQGELIARAAAMSSNVLSVVYDATALRIRVSWEVGSGPDWQPANQHDYLELPLGDLFSFVKTLPTGEGGTK